MNRKDALLLLNEHVTTDQLLRHSFAVEASMKAYAKKFNEDEVRWSLLGLLHDIDFEKYPETHPAQAPELLEGKGFDVDFINAILSHGLNSDIERDTIDKKVLHAVDQMSSFILAIALLRPTKLEGLKAKSVKKKMKDKAFAKAVDREELKNAMACLEVELGDHVDTIVSGLIEHEKLLNEEGYSFF